MKKLYLILLLIVSAVITSYIVYATYTKVNPLGAVKLDYNMNSIKEKADSLFNNLGMTVENKTRLTTLQPNKLLIKTLYEEYSFSEANRLLRERIPGYYWEVGWGKNEGGVRINNDGNGKNTGSAGDMTLDFDTRGNLLKLKRPMNDSLKLEPVSENEARQIAIGFISKYSPINVEDSLSQLNRYKIKDRFSEKSVQKTEKQNRTDYKFSWEAQSADINKKLLVSAAISGNTVSEYELSFDIPDSSDEHSGIFDLVTTLPFYLVIYILIIIIGYKRIRAYEVSFRLAIIMGLIVGLLFSINLYTLISESSGWELWLPLIFSTFFFAGGVLITWSVAETIAREVWKEKFISLDLLTKGYAFHSKVGRAGITGLTGGFIIYLIWTGILYISENIMHIRFVTSDNSSLITHFYSISPALNILDKSIYPQIYAASVFLLFVFSGLKRRFSSLYILIPISAVLWGVINFNNMYPLYWGIITGVIISALFLLFFNYFDVLAALIALSAYNILNISISLFTTDNFYYQKSGYYLIAVFIILIILLIIGLYTKDRITEYDSITPAFVKNITERQRLQRELEIARDVQMSFLPAKDPQFSGLDIAAHCIPALEVGGDYYDYVKLNETRFGITIGDVSGKGTQAAFYMTLAKGFVKALSKTVSSPSEFLIKINELFYENVERGTFISMIYGIFDLKEKTLTFARAGHNPVIARHSGKSEVELLNPVGLALGLEKGTIFNKTIKEIKIDIHPGDTFVFYTDGFTEAMNRYKLEFSEKRLKESISNYINLPAKDLLEKTIADVNTFIGTAVQHDDMTMVVVKVAENYKS